MQDKQKNGIIQVVFPTFDFIVCASDNFECSVTPGADSGKPVLWKLHETEKFTTISFPDKFQNKLAISRLQCQMLQDMMLPPMPRSQLNDHQPFSFLLDSQCHCISLFNAIYVHEATYF